jgi:hypothetical protein
MLRSRLRYGFDSESKRLDCAANGRKGDRRRPTQGMLNSEALTERKISLAPGAEF